MLPTPSQFALSSKRWRAGLGGMLLMVAVSTPWLGIAPDVAEQLREFFAAIVVSYIAGQTVTDVVTKGRTSGSLDASAPTQVVSIKADPDLNASVATMDALIRRAEALTPPGGNAPMDAKGKDPATAGRAALPALLLAAGLGLVALSACSEIPLFGNVVAAEERAAAAELELSQAQAEVAAVRTELVLAGARAAELEAVADRLAAAETAAAEASAQAATSAEAAAALEAALAGAEAARAEMAALLAQAPSGEALEALLARLTAAEAAGASAAAAAATAREDAAAARQAAAEGTGAAAGLAGPGLGQVLGLLGLLGAAGAAEWGRARAMRRAASTPTAR